MWESKDDGTAFKDSQINQANDSPPGLYKVNDQTLNPANVTWTNRVNGRIDEHHWRHIRIFLCDVNDEHQDRQSYVIGIITITNHRYDAPSTVYRVFTLSNRGG